MHDVDKAHDAAPTLALGSEPSSEQLLEGYRKMLLIRRFEEAALYQSTQAKVHGTLHLYIGQEACAAGVCVHLNESDYVASHHRGHGHCLAKGAQPDRMMAELFGRVDGYCRGKGGSMHIADFSRGMLGANGIVAAGIGLAAGASLSHKQAGTDGVAIAFFGDGASTRGPFHEVANIAALWKLPLVLVCENNGYAQWVSHEKNLAVKDVYRMASAYGMPSRAVDGNDFVEVCRAAGAAVDRARRGDGPSLIECKTYRIYGHSLGDMNVYRTKEDIDAWRAPDKDPLLRLEALLESRGMLDAGRRDAMCTEIDKTMQEAVEFASASPYPDPGALYEDITQAPPVRRPAADFDAEMDHE